MLVATEALRPPKLRIGKIGQNFTLPRTVPAAALITGGVLGLVFIGIFGALVGYTIQSVMYSGVVGAAFGVFLVSYSPMRGESLARWLGLKVKTRGKRPRMVHGQPVRLAVGICYVDPPVSGPVQVRPGAIPVRAGSFDDRGVRLEERRWTAPIADGHHRAGPPWIVAETTSGSPKSPTAAMAAYREASATSALDGVRPPRLEGPSAASRHGRWVQDPSTLDRLYRRQEHRSRPRTPTAAPVDLADGDVEA